MVTAALLHVLTPDIPSQSCSEAQEGSQPGCTEHLPNCLNNFMSSIVVFVLKLNRKKRHIRCCLSRVYRNHSVLKDTGAKHTGKGVFEFHSLKPAK